MAQPTKPVVHLELHTGDLEGAHTLYSELCGWPREQIETAHGSYLALDLGRGIGGGIVECSVRRPIWLPYVEVDDIRRTDGRRPPSRCGGAARAAGGARGLAQCHPQRDRRRDRVLATETLTPRLVREFDAG